MKLDYTGLRVIGVMLFGDHVHGGMIVRWEAPRIGFGELTIHVRDGKAHSSDDYLGEDATVEAYTERMSREFCKAVMAALVDHWVVME